MNANTDVELATVAEMYIPIMDDTGNYVDSVPKIIGGLRCSCGVRKDFVYKTKDSFKQHTNSVCHKRWIYLLNANKSHYYSKCIKQKKIIESQKLIIRQQSKKIQIKNHIIQEKDTTIKHLLLQLILVWVTVIDMIACYFKWKAVEKNT
jgi:hypothetical protein